MNAVFDLAHKEVDGDIIPMAGKSLGSMITWQVLRSAPQLKGAILLTPACIQPVGTDAVSNYPGLSVEARPCLWILGDINAVCPVASFYRFIASGAGMKLPVIGWIEPHIIWEADRRAGFQFERLIRADDFADLLALLGRSVRLPAVVKDGRPRSLRT